MIEENDFWIGTRKIEWYHGTTKENAESILKNGFNKWTFFTPFLNTAIDQGGEYVFAVFFETSPTYYWEHCSDEIIPVDRILWLKLFSSTQLYYSSSCERKLRHAWLKNLYPDKDVCSKCDGKGQTEEKICHACKVCHGHGVVDKKDHEPIKKSNFNAMASKPHTPKVGVGILFERKKDNLILLGKRKGSHGAGQWSLPGGHLEVGESFIDCCKRESLEETGIVINDIIKVDTTNDIMAEEHLHYVTIYFQAIWGEKQKPKLLEPDRCEEWVWFNLDDIPEDTYEPVKKMLIKYNQIRIREE